jgi:hypothetical protein
MEMSSVTCPPRQARLQICFLIRWARHPKHMTRRFVGEVVKVRHDSLFFPSLTTECEFLGKACDQCRKSKCKCERTSDNESCKACIMLGTREFCVVQFVEIFFAFSWVLVLQESSITTSLDGPCVCSSTPNYVALLRSNPSLQRYLSVKLRTDNLRL